MKKLSAIIAMFITVIMFTTSCTKEDDKPTLSSEKQISGIVFNQFTPAVVASIDQNNKTATASIPANSNITALVPTITVSNGATINPASGTVVDFTLPVIFTVTAEDGSTTAYTVSVTLEGGGMGSETLSGGMSANRTLVNRNDGIDYIIDGYFYIEGNALLTIEPGVKIAFTSVNSGISVGENAGLKMAGTAQNPIVLTGPVNNQNKGSWDGVSIYSARSDNQFEYVQFINGGSNSDWAVVVLYYNAKLKMNHCMMDGSLGSGVMTTDLSQKITSFDNNTIKNCDKYPLVISDLAQCSVLNETTQLTLNSKPVVWVNGLNMTEDFTLNKTTVPYAFENSFYLENNLTIGKGVQLLFSADCWINVINSGRIQVNGTAAEPVLFSKLNASASNWEGLYISNDKDNTLNYCTIEYAGSNSSFKCNIVLEYSSKLIMSNVTIDNSRYYGIGLHDDSMITHTNVTFSGNPSGNVYNFDTDEVSSGL
ncbi:MAG: DUF5018 domain-containing protein [Lentimicrobiaceae bacterium]|nr:DUF5018 domain-containing protein [Lentimicrobiaceae bacterium]MCB9023603.1 DUF5018 domain-containing protein [Lentimicrobiaceae bacterium]MCO5264364.1 hypothetical protein [Lentimicrobium sp.]HPG33561.1 hypothetical protein [Lentimicrobium sp.]